MTSGTPESTQNWVLPGFQNSLDLASMSPLEAKAMSSSATVTSASGGHHRACAASHRSSRHPRSAPAQLAPSRPSTSVSTPPLPQHIHASAPGASASNRLVQPNKYRM